MDLYEKYRAGLPYDAFLEKHANPGQQQRWADVLEQVALTDQQTGLLQSFRRQMPVLCLAGAWCGDCINQCPIFEAFARACPQIQVRYIDRDIHADAQRELRVNAGDRVPVLVFFAEDGAQVARYGDRTLSKYRSMMAQMEGDTCPTGLILPGDDLLASVTQDWLNEFERVQWLLQLSPRLRRLHGG